MATFFTSDLHLGHLNIISYCSRPYESVRQMNDDLVARWNATVGPNDDVIVVGDVAMGRLDESLGWVSGLHGDKYLVPGNHDRMFETDGDDYRRQVDRYLQAGFVEVFEEQIDVELPGGKVALVCHFPFFGEEDHDSLEARFPDHQPADTGGWLLHGHQHGSWRRHGRMIDVGVDAWGGYPVAAERLVDTFASDVSELVALPWEPGAPSAGKRSPR